MEQLSPSPQSNDEGAMEQKRAFLASLKWVVTIPSSKFYSLHMFLSKS